MIHVYFNLLKPYYCNNRVNLTPQYNRNFEYIPWKLAYETTQILADYRVMLDFELWENTCLTHGGDVQIESLVY